MENKLKSFVSIFPNPIKDKVTIQTKSKLISIEIIDCLSRTIITKLDCINNEAIIDLSEIKSGGFIARIKTTSETQYVKIIKE